MPSSCTDEPAQPDAVPRIDNIATSSSPAPKTQPSNSPSPPSPARRRKNAVTKEVPPTMTTSNSVPIMHSSPTTTASLAGPKSISSQIPSSMGQLPLSSLRRSLSEQFNLIPEDRAVHITSVNRDGFTYQYRRESTNVTQPKIATVAWIGSSIESFIRFFLLCIRLLLCWPLLVYCMLQRSVAFLFTAPISTNNRSNSRRAQQHRRTQHHRRRLKQWPFLMRLGLRFVGMPALNIAKHIVDVLCTPAAERRRPKRTILLSGGSTIQALHLARNFQAAGYRVVAAETEGRFALVAFSRAVSQYYTLPAAAENNETTAYVDALYAIAQAEHPILYVPVCATTAAQCDALAKPLLTQLGCEVFVPGFRECAVLDDIAEVLLQCRRLGMAVPRHRYVRSVAELLGLYDAGWMRKHGANNNNRVLLHAIGLNVKMNMILPTLIATTASTNNGDGEYDDDYSDGDGKEENSRYLVLPLERSKVAAAVEALDINEHRPWLVLAEPAGGESLHTCTTVRDSMVVANVTCRRDADGGRLRPDIHEAGQAVDTWLQQFFARLRLQRPIDGHFAFRLVQCKENDGRTVIVPVGIRVGVPAAYMCHTGVQTRVLMPPCRHFSRQRSGPLVHDGDRYWVHEALVAALRNRAWLEALRRVVVESVVDGGEALFVYWDPLPGVAYAMWQVPQTCWRWWRFWGRHGNR